MWSESTALRSGILSAGWLLAWSSPVIEIRDGVRPSSADDASVGSLLCTVTLPTPHFTVSGDAVVKTGTWEAEVSASGTPTWFRIMEEGDTGAYSVVDARMDGDVGQVGTFSEMEMSLPIIAGDTLSLQNFRIERVEPALEARSFMAVEHDAAIAMLSTGAVVAAPAVDIVAAIAVAGAATVTANGTVV